MEDNLKTIALLAHFLENWLGFSSTGFQDQLAALHGGANLWSWGADFKSETPLYTQTDIMPLGGPEQLGEHMLLCFTGQSHLPNRAGEQFKRLPTVEMQRWEKVAKLTLEFSSSLRSAEWENAANLLNLECAVREEIATACLSTRSKQLAAAARQCGSGCRYAGHGHGGCMWAVGETRAIQETKDRWCRLAKKWKGAWVITPGVARMGLIRDGVCPSDSGLASIAR
jgi:D-glycero-alpha-D-manno-heptose-7-phosphate kinase